MKCKNNAGFTLIEVMIALSIVIVVGAVISLSLTDRLFISKIKADIQSTRVLRSALDLYEAEQHELLQRANAENDFEILRSKDYIKNSVITAQSGGSWVYVTGQLYLQLDYTDSVKKAVEGLTEEELSMIIGVTQ